MVNVSRARCGTQQVDVVLNTDNAQDVGCDELGFITLVLPLRGTGQGDHSVFDCGIDSGGDHGVEH
jgi:hypothetical protein